MQLVNYLQAAVDSEIVNQLLPLGDSILQAMFTLGTALLTYFFGRKKAQAELENLQAEKRSIEAASGVSTADAAKIISEAAASTVQPLMERLREQREDINFLTERNVFYRKENEDLRIIMAKVVAENNLMKEQFKLQGKAIPELPNTIQEDTK